MFWLLCWGDAQKFALYQEGERRKEGKKEGGRENEDKAMVLTVARVWQGSQL